MVRTSFLFLTALAAATSWYVVAGGRDTAADGDVTAHGMPTPMEAEFGTLDTNADRRIDRAEARAYEELEQNFDQLDENSDGELSEAEFSAFERARAAETVHNSELKAISPPTIDRGLDRGRDDEVVRGREPR